MAMAMHYDPWIGDPRDPACPYDDDYTPEDEEAAYESYIDSRIDEMIESRYE